MKRALRAKPSEGGEWGVRTGARGRIDGVEAGAVGDEQNEWHPDECGYFEARDDRERRLRLDRARPTRESRADFRPSDLRAEIRATRMLPARITEEGSE